MDRRTIVRGKMAALLKNFQPFLQECEKRGFPIAKMRFREAFPGDITTPIWADVLTEWAGERGPIAVGGILEDILEVTVPKEQQDSFCGFNVENTPERFMLYERPEPYLQLLAG